MWACLILVALGVAVMGPRAVMGKIDCITAESEDDETVAVERECEGAFADATACKVTHNPKAATAKYKWECVLPADATGAGPKDCTQIASWVHKDGIWTCLTTDSHDKLHPVPKLEVFAAQPDQPTGPGGGTPGGDNGGTPGGDNGGTPGGDNGGTPGGDNGGTPGGDNGGTPGGGTPGGPAKGSGDSLKPGYLPLMVAVVVVLGKSFVAA